MTSKLEELIAELCPNGVEYKALKKCVFKIDNIKWKNYNGNDKSYIDLSSVDIDRHIVICYQSINAVSAPSRAQQIIKKNDVLFGTTRPMLRRYCIIDDLYNDEICSTGFCVLRANPDVVLPRWIYHIISTNDFFAYIENNQNGASYPSISDSLVKDFEIPVPSLEVQSEIVRILDTFTELTAELTARKKQYEYYRDTLLTFDDNNPLHSLISRYCPNGVEYKKIGDIASVDRGGSLQKKDFCEHGIPCIHYGQIYTKYGLFASKSYTFIDSECASKQRFAHKNDIVMAVTSENIEDVCKCVAWFGEEDVAVSGHSAIIRHNQNAKYLVYYFHSSMFFLQKKKLAHGTKVIEVTPSDLLDVKIPVPPLEVQRQIVQILDRFDALCNDLTQGLPAEIEARRKQYEYYRDQLLTFKRA